MSKIIIENARLNWGPGEAESGSSLEPNGGLLIQGNFSISPEGSVSLPNHIILADGSADFGGGTFRIGPLGQPPTISFFNGGPVPQQLLNGLTNDLSISGDDDYVADYPQLADYSVDASAIRGNLFQITRKIQQIYNALFSYGLIQAP